MDDGIKWDVPTDEDIVSDIENAIDKISIPFLKDYMKKAIWGKMKGSKMADKNSQVIINGMVFQSDTIEIELKNVTDEQIAYLIGINERHEFIPIMLAGVFRLSGFNRDELTAQIQLLPR